MVNEIPELKWYQFHTDEYSDPSGERHIVGGAFAFNKVVASGVCASGMDFGEVSLVIGGSKTHYVSTPIALIFHLNDVSRGSGVDGLRFFLTDDSAFDGDGSEPKPFVQMFVSSSWRPYLSMPSGTGAKMVPNNVPLLSNVKRQDGLHYIEGTTDQWVSQYVYMNLVVPSHYLVGDYGVCGSGTLRFAVSYDYYEIT